MAEIQKVTDPAKIVTDPVLLSALAEQGIDKDYVELTQDYAPAYFLGARVKGKSPYAKYYRDLQSDRHFAVVSGLPMVQPTGRKVACEWQEKNTIFSIPDNLFQVSISKGNISLVCPQDQPDGRKNGDTLNFFPQIFLSSPEENEVRPLSELPRILDIDPWNANYACNVLEWDYGFCRRRIRVVEGRIHGYWIFTANPGADVRIRYNQSGDFHLKLGRFTVSPDEEFIPAFEFDSPQAVYPLIVSDSMTFYPDAHPESTSVDGRTWHQYSLGSGVTWATLIANAGNTAYDNDTEICIQINSDNVSAKWRYVIRSPILFDTSGLPDAATISAATLSLYGGASGKVDNLGITPNINIYACNPASTTSLTGTDYATFQGTAFSTAIAYGSWQTAAYNDFVLNASGRAAISKTGISKFGARNANYDVAAQAPSWSSNTTSYIYAYAAEQGAGYKPKLVVTYTPPIEKSSSEIGSGAESLGSRLLGITEAGSALETELLLAAVITGDSGLGSEIGGLLKTIYDGDSGTGFDALKTLIGAEGSSSDMRLYDRPGQVKIPSKGVNL